MKRNRLLVLAAFVIVGLVPISVSAQTATANLSVTASVSANCTITTVGVALGAYDPIVANAAADKDGTGSVTIACTKGSVPKVGLGVGANASGSTRRMLGAAGEFLTYELYQPGGWTTVWGNVSPAWYAPGAAAGKAPQTFTVNGRITAGQDVAAGAYTDTVVATVNF
jgi:spore coat protein U-like protein